MGSDLLPIFKSLQIQAIHNMIQFAMCKLGHNISHKHWPDPIIQLFDKFGGKKKHHYPTCNKHIPNIQQHQSELYKKSFLCGSIREYNKLPFSLRQQNKGNAFINQLKKCIALS